MARVQIDPAIEQRAILPVAGKYGHGHDVECDCELSRFEWPAKERMPAFDREGNDGPYAYFGMRLTLGAGVIPDFEGGVIYYDHWEPIRPGSGSRARKWLVNLGVEGAAEGDFEDSTVAPRKCAIDVGEPRKEYEKDANGKKTTVETGRVFSGYIRNVIGA